MDGFRLSEVPRQVDHITEAVLQSFELGLTDEVFPIEVRIIKDHPRQTLHYSYVEITLGERRQQELGRIGVRLGAQMGKSRIPEGTEFRGQIAHALVTSLSCGSPG